MLNEVMFVTIVLLHRLLY